MVCTFCGILRAVSSLLQKFFFASVVTWELLGNICSEQLEGHNFKGCRQSMQYAGVQSFYWLKRLSCVGAVVGSITLGVRSEIETSQRYCHSQLCFG